MNRDLLLGLGLVTGLGLVLGVLWGLGVFASEDTDRFGTEDANVAIEKEEGRGVKRRESGDSKEEEPEPEEVVSAPTITIDSEGTETIEELDAFGVPFAGLDVLVRDPDGQPLSGAVVTVFADLAPGRSQQVRGDEVTASTTDEDGAVRFADLQGDGEFILRVRHQAYVDAHRAPVILNPGRFVTMTVDLEDGLELTGRVVREDSGAPVEGVEVVVDDLQVISMTFESMMERRVVTDADGGFRIPGLGAGPKLIYAHCEGFATASRTRMDLNARSAAVALELKLVPGLTIEGQVIDPDGRPVRGARVGVRYLPLGSGKTPRHVLPATTDDRGRYVVEGLVAGHYTLTASADGYRSGSVFRQRGGGARGEVIRSGNSMRNAQAGDRDVELILLPSSGLAGRVIDDATGEPVSAFTITACPRPVLIGKDGRNSRRFVDEDGAFVMSSPLIDDSRQEIYLFATAPGYAGGKVSVNIAARLASEERVQVDGLEIRMSRGGIVRGKIVDLEGQPVASARVQVYPVESGTSEGEDFLRFIRRFNRTPGKTAMSEADGTFVVPGLMSGSHRIRIEHPEFAVWEADEARTVDEGNETDIGRIEVFRGGTIVGTVKDAGGKRIESAIVKLRSLEPSNGETIEVRTGMAGVFEFKHVAPGNYRLSASRQMSGQSGRTLDLGALLPGSGPNRREFLIAEGEERRFDLEVR